MKTLALAAMLLSPIASLAMAQDFNPGTVIGNVYQNPASGCGYGFGFDCYPPGYGHYEAVHSNRYAWLRRHARKDTTTAPNAQR